MQITDREVNKLNAEKLSIISMLFIVDSYLRVINEKLSQQFTQAVKLSQLKENELFNEELCKKAFELAFKQQRSTGSGENVFSLKSIFNELLGNSPEKVKFLKLNLLQCNISELYPCEKSIHSKEELINYFEYFIEEIKQVNQLDQIYYIILKYFYNLPVLNNGDCDISVFDIAKLTAAINVCLVNDNNFMFIKGDMSGIQDFIFNVSSKGASKSLKGHSVYISLLSDIIVKYIIRQLKLSNCNIIYNGGGNFYLLAPASKKSEFENLRKDILKKLLKVLSSTLFHSKTSQKHQIISFYKH